MPDRQQVLSTFDTFGSLLKHLRRQARMTQRELSIAVGYSESQISRLETNERAPDLASITALFITALGLEKDAEAAARLVELAKTSRAAPDAGGAAEGMDVAGWDPRSRPRTNLLLELSSFIGREREVRYVSQALSGEIQLLRPRLFTLTGSGGVGKTRLALRAGMGLVESFEHGVWLAALAPISDPAMIPSAVISELGIHGEASKPELEVLIDYLQPRDILLILDNCEHMIVAAARLAAELLSRCDGLHILATSREPLGVPGELTFRVPSLALPEDGAAIDTVESVHLFVERARSARPGFFLTQDNQAAVAHICQRLDGIPLAIELAAARVRALSVEQIAGHLDDSFHLLTGGSRTLLPRQQTIRASIDWSYRLLSEPEKTLLARLSVFSGGWTVEMAEAVFEDASSGLVRGEIIDLLALLVTKSLVSADLTLKPARYWMLETIRQYAAERLQEAGETAGMRNRHLDAILQWVERLETHLRGPDQVELLDQLEADLPNLRAALEWSLASEEPANAEKGLRLAGALRWLWHIRSKHTEGVEWLKKMLAANPPGSQKDPLWIAARARGLSDLAFLNLFINRVTENLPFLEESDSLFRSIGDQGKFGLIRNLYVFENTMWGLGDKKRGEELITEMLALAEEVGDRFNLAEGLDSAVSYSKSLEQSLRMHNRAMNIRRELGDIDGLFLTFYFRAHAYWFYGDFERAKHDTAEALLFAKKSKNWTGYIRVLSFHGWLHIFHGNLWEGLDDLDQALRIGREVESDDYLCTSLVFQGAARMWIRSNIGENLGAEKYLEEAIEIATRQARKNRLAEALFYLGETALLDGELALAEERYREAAQIFGEISEMRYERVQQYSFGKCALLRGEVESARDSFQHSLRIVMKLNYPWEKHFLFSALAQVLSACPGEEEIAVILQGAADAHPPVDSKEDFGERMLYARYDSRIVLEKCRAALGELRFSAAYAQGQSLTVEQAAEIALQSFSG